MKTKTILVAAAIITLAIPIAIALRSSVGEEPADIPANTLSTANSHPQEVDQKTESEAFTSIKPKSAQASKVVEQTTAAAMHVLNAIQQDYDKTIAEWQQKQTLIVDPECDQNVREAIQDDANLIATHAKLQEQEMKHFRARMEAYLKEIKGEPNEAGDTLLSAFDQRAKKRSLRLLFDEGGGIPKKARDRSGHDSNKEGGSEALDEIQLLSIELFRAVDKGDDDLARIHGARMIELFPDHPSGYIQIVGALIHEGETTDAEEALALSMDKFPDSAEFLYLAGQLAFSSGNYKEAQGSFEKVLGTPHPKGWTLFAAKDEAALSGLINDDPEFRNVGQRDLADISPIDYMRFEQRLAQELGTQEIVAAWDDVISRFGTLATEVVVPVPSPAQEVGEPSSIDSSAITITSPGGMFTLSVSHSFKKSETEVGEPAPIFAMSLN